jgi:uncharacterized protein
LSSSDLGFLAGMAEKLGYYVYALVDPEGGIFYVGKGKGDRVYKHAMAALAIDGEKPAELKLNTIRRIHRRGQAVGIEIIRHGLDEKEAFEVEGAVIDVLRMTGHHLTNQASGKWSRNQGYARLEELRARYAATPVDIKHRAMLVRIRKRYRAGISPEELYTATRQWWKLSPHHRPDYAFSVYGGVVRAVYAIDQDGWERDDASGRWRFSGKQDLDLEAEYRWRDVSSYLPDGAQNPIRYVNC